MRLFPISASVAQNISAGALHPQQFFFKLSSSHVFKVVLNAYGGLCLFLPRAAQPLILPLPKKTWMFGRYRVLHLPMAATEAFDLHLAQSPPKNWLYTALLLRWGVPLEKDDRPKFHTLAFQVYKMFFDVLSQSQPEFGQELKLFLKRMSNHDSSDHLILLTNAGDFMQIKTWKQSLQEKNWMGFLLIKNTPQR